MREIEVKAKLRNKNLFLKATKNLNIEFSKVINQKDVTYEATLEHDDPNWNIFRIRKQDDILILTMKHKASTRKRDNYEYETVVANEHETVKILNRLGYKFAVEVNKKRRTARYKDLELCLDEVDKLGTFVEVERLIDNDADVDKVQDELWTLLIQLGVGPEDRIYQAYDTMMKQFLSDNKIFQPKLS